MKRSRERERVLDDERRRLLLEVDNLRERLENSEDSKRQVVRSAQEQDTEKDLMYDFFFFFYFLFNF